MTVGKVATCNEAHNVQSGEGGRGCDGGQSEDARDDTGRMPLTLKQMGCTAIVIAAAVACVAQASITSEEHY